MLGDDGREFASEIDEREPLDDGRSRWLVNGSVHPLGDRGGEIGVSGRRFAGDDGRDREVDESFSVLLLPL